MLQQIYKEGYKKDLTKDGDAIVIYVLISCNYIVSMTTIGLTGMIQKPGQLVS